MFADREHAGRQLAARLLQYKNADVCVLALPRGGVPVAFEVARALNAPLDIALARKISVPSQPELALGAVAGGTHPDLVLNEAIVEALGITNEEISAICTEELREMERVRALYAASRVAIDRSEKVAILVDDGIATGATMRAAIRATRGAGARAIVVACPVAALQTIAMLRAEADEVICLDVRRNLGAVGSSYDDFSQVTDATVRELMLRSQRLPAF